MIATSMLAALLVLAPVPAAQRQACAAPVPSTTQPGYTVADPGCDPGGTPFEALPGARARTGTVAGAAYRIEVPDRWNGELVIWAHGYRGTGTTVYVSNPPLRAHLLAEGFAWAASSYQTNGYDVEQGVRDSHALIDLFRQVTGKRARDVYLTGESMGGHVTAAAIEQYPRSFAGAMPTCGVLGDTELYDYFLDANVTAAAIAGVHITFPVDATTWRAQVARITAGLTGDKAKLWSGVVERRTGGERPGFDASFASWNAARSLPPLDDLPFLFGLHPGLTGGTAGIANGNVTDNRFTVYRSTDGHRLTPAERRLNAEVLRVRRTATEPSGIPRVNGTPRIPVLSLHGLGDLFVPFSMEQYYAARTAAHGRSKLFVSRAVRATGHCDFTQPELRRGFDDLVHWVRGGKRPAGDAILDRRAVASPAFGCRFTVGARPQFPACPA
ncbi:phthalyl amidase [Actinoplanes sp. N902-109]|uniref:phthalyl amidase n=1 Tax=Actinoplanes sp. (strain N902-109) TaxID=649831 RepID=UPI00039CE0FC|nr:phthalyl amidase [Actinoplanes sp. N902-109]